MHWIKLGFEALKHAWKSFPLLLDKAGVAWDMKTQRCCLLVFEFFFLKKDSGMHWIKLGFEALKHAWKSFPLLMRTGAWGQHLLALGLETAT